MSNRLKQTIIISLLSFLVIAFGIFAVLYQKPAKEIITDTNTSSDSEENPSTIYYTPSSSNPYDVLDLAAKNGNIYITDTNNQPSYTITHQEWIEDRYIALFLESKYYRTLTAAIDTTQPIESALILEPAEYHSFEDLVELPDSVYFIISGSGD